MTRSRCTARAGFTLLETVLAMAVGSLVLAAALAVMGVVQNSERSLSDHASGMNDLARVQLAARRALSDLRPAQNSAVRDVITRTASAEAADTLLRQQFPDPIPGLPARFEMTNNGRPRLEVVLRSPLLDPPSERSRGPAADGPLGRVVTASMLPGHRGAFELREEPPSSRANAKPARGPSLWWVPLRPRSVPAGVTFDDSTLPPPRRLCRDVTLLRWTAFIDSERVPRIRAVQFSQYPAFVELEIGTAGGGYGNWTFELGAHIGDELIPPPEPADGDGAGNDDDLSLPDPELDPAFDPNDPGDAATSEFQNPFENQP